MQVHAWLGLRPDKDGPTNAEQYGDELPPIDDEEGYLLSMLAELGTVSRGFDCVLPLSYSEIRAWSLLTGYRLNQSEAAALQALSCAYSVIANDSSADFPLGVDGLRDRIDAVNIASWKQFAA